TARVSVTAAGKELADGGNDGQIAPGGDRAAFWSTSGDLSAGDSNGLPDVFNRTLSSGAVTLLSRGLLADLGANGASSVAAGPTQLSDDGRYLVFTSDASNLVASADANGPARDVYWYDRQQHQMVRVSAP